MCPKSVRNNALKTRTTEFNQIRKLYYNIVRVTPQLGSVPAMLPDLPIQRAVLSKMQSLI